jgi:hypothetical protein
VSEPVDEKRKHLADKLRKTATMLMEDGAHFNRCFIDGNVRALGVVVYTQFQIAHEACRALSLILQSMAALIESCP